VENQINLLTMKGEHSVAVPSGWHPKTTGSPLGGGTITSINRTRHQSDRRDRHSL